MFKHQLKYIFCFCLAVAALFCPIPAKSFSILAHEAIIDSEWDRTLKPILLKRYPQSTLEDLIKAHSFAYGGSLVADMGYLPGGNSHFTDLLHYVRSGDFIINLLNEAQSLDEYAFALGALSHYVADKYGHSLATNITVPNLYPKLKAKFGNVVTYDNDHTSHSRMEFAYDVVQVGRSNYATVAYHDFIGFNVATAPLERAFLKTYGQELNVLFKNFDSSISIMRWGVKNLFPAMTKSAWKAKRDEIVKNDSKAKKRSFKYKMSRRMYNKEYTGKNNKPDFKARALSFLVKILPKVGPLKNLKFVYPGLDGEKRFERVFDTIIVKYAVALNQWDAQKLTLVDINLDTGHTFTFGEYGLADKTYCELVQNLQKNQFACLTPDIQQHICAYFNGALLHNMFIDNPEDEDKLKQALLELKNHKPTNNTITPVTALQK